MKKTFFFVLIIGSLFMASWLAKLALLGTPAARPVVKIEIQAGQGTADVARTLHGAGVIQRPYLYRVFALLYAPARRVKPGPYVLRPGTSFRDIARALALGPARKESSLTVIEGWSVDDIAQLLRDERAIPLEQTQALIGRSADQAPFDSALRSDFPFLKDLPKNRSLEGYLMPDTYRVWDDQLPDGLVLKQLGEFEERFGLKRPNPGSPLKTLDEVVILASIVEREVRHPEERRHVAGIFLNRLKIGMALQSDATIGYVTQSGRAQANSEDLALDSRYNTYTYPGLPPGPIGNPGTSSIEAVLDPLETDDLYFLTNAEGKVLYAETFEGHKINRTHSGY